MDRRRIIKACIARAFGACLVLTSDTYVFMLFLSAYPKSSIPYLYLVLGLVAFTVMRLTQPLLQRNLIKFMEITHLLFIAVLIFFAFLANASWHWGPFVIAVSILTMVAIGNTTDWIIVQSMFNLREFKTVSRWISITSTVAVILMGLLIPLLLAVFNTKIVLYIIIALFLGALLIERFVPVEPQKKEVVPSRQVATSVLKQPLYIYTFIVMMMMLQLYIFADYSFKSQLGLHFDKTQIGQFLAPFSAVTNSITILMQIFVGPAILRRFGVIGLIMVCPIFFIIAAGVLFGAPSLWTATLIAGVANIMRYGLFQTGSQMIYNVYPPAVRNITQYKMQSFGRGLGVAVGGIALIILGAWSAGLREVAIAAMVMSAVMIYATIQLGKNYFATLKQAINLHRFDTDYLSTQATDQEMILRTSAQALQEKSEDVKLFGLSLLGQLKLQQVPVGVREALFSEYESVEMAAINLMHHSDDEAVVPLLMQKLQSEKKPIVIEALVEAIVRFSPKFLLSYAAAGIDSSEPAIKAASVAVLLKAGDQEQAQQATAVLHAMVYHNESQYRYCVASVLESVYVEGWEDDVLHLIHDPDHQVVRNVLPATRQFPSEKIIEALVEKMDDRALTYAIGNALVAIGARAIPVLLNAIQHFQRLYPMNNAILLLSKFSDAEAEEALLKLLDTDNCALLEVCAISLAYRTRKFALSAAAMVKVSANLFQEVERIKSWSQSRSFYEDADVANEIRWRIYYARKQYLYFLAATVGSAIILQMIPTLLKANRASTAYSSALELLELSVKEQQFKLTISLALEGKQATKPKALAESCLDSWLKSVLEFKQGKLVEETMGDIIANVLVLRKVPLFASLSAELLQTIAVIVQQQSVAANEVLFRQGDWGDGMYIVAKGRVNIMQNEQLIKVCNNETFFGELALLDDEPRVASAIAAEDSNLFFIEKSEFIRLTDEVPEILRAVTQAVLGYLRHPTAHS